MTAREVSWEIVVPEITNVDRGEAEVDIGFRGVTISHEPFRSHEKNISLRKAMIMQACWLKIAVVSPGLQWTGRCYINNC